MLRPAVAATNRARDGGSAGLDVLIRSLMPLRNLAIGPTLRPRTGAVNDRGETALSQCKSRIKEQWSDPSPREPVGRIDASIASVGVGVSTMSTAGINDPPPWPPLRGGRDKRS